MKDKKKNNRLWSGDFKLKVVVIVNDKYYNFDCEKTINYDC